MEKPKFRRFNDLSAADVNFDFHMHTTQTDGKNSAAEMIAAGERQGLTAIAFSEHVDRSSGWYPEFVAHVDAARAEAGIDVYIGIEAKALDFEGTIDATDDVLTTAELVVGSVHRFPDGNGGLVPMAQVPALGEERTMDIEFRLALGLVTNPQRRLDVLGHPMGITTSRFGGFPEESLRALMTACRDSGVAFEISTKYSVDLARLVLLLKETNPTVSIGSDAHAVADVARDFAQIRSEITRCR